VAELAEAARFYVAPRPLALDARAAGLVTREARILVGELAARIEASADWTEGALEGTVRDFAESRGVKLGQVAQPLRAALTGATASPPIFEVMAVLGRTETLGRMRDFAEGTAK
jgi:glutamyl-tRNA synthetase